MEQKKNMWVWIVVAVIVVAIIVYAVMTGVGPKPTVEQGAVGEETEQGVVTEKGVVAAPGTSPISTSTGEVVTPEGKPVQNDVIPGTPEAPQQSNPISVEELPAAAIKLDVSAGGFSPNQFTVKSGSPVTISITATDNQTHVFKFDDASLSAIAVGVGPGETRAITFNAPARGEYTFKCDVPGHAGRGETGKMIVQ